MRRITFPAPAILCLAMYLPIFCGSAVAQEAAVELALSTSPNPQKLFPNLRRFQILAPSTPNYNCISHAIGLHDRWLWPGSRVEDFDRLFGQVGYSRQRLRPTAGVRIECIVLYGKRDETGGVEITHAARALADGTFTSKLGRGPLIRHATLTDLAGGFYGMPVAVYYRYHYRRNPLEA